MDFTLAANAKDCGELVAFQDAAGKLTFINKNDLDAETELLHSNPKALKVKVTASAQKDLEKFLKKNPKKTRRVIQLLGKCWTLYDATHP